MEESEFSDSGSSIGSCDDDLQEANFEDEAKMMRLIKWKVYMVIN